jgi:hypothetical protein
MTSDTNSCAHCENMAGKYGGKTWWGARIVHNKQLRQQQQHKEEQERWWGQHLQLLFKLGRILSHRRVEQTATKKMLKTVAAVTIELVSKAAAAGAMKMAAAAAVAKIHIVLGWVQGHIRCLNVCALKSNCGRRD